MILQSIAWPERPEDKPLYYRCADATAAGGTLRLGDAPATFDAYFSMFSLAKWRKYTRLGGVALRLELRGDAEVALLRHHLADGAIQTEAVRSEAFSCGDFRQITLEYPDCDGAEALSFTLKPLAPGAQARNIAYVAAADAPEPQDVRLALAICTYRREACLDATLALLRRTVFDDPASPLRDRLRVYVADNGRTLDAARYAGLPVRVLPNPNAGGSGGFSRAAIEAVHDPDFPATHVILMDDDIELPAGALERNAAFLSLLRPEYRDSLMGGAMLNADHRCLVQAGQQLYTLDGIVNDKKGLDLSRAENALLCEREQPANYFSWWYCCVPAALLERRGYALPFFVQFDDVEFGLRWPEAPKLMLNGVCCWHEPHERRDGDAQYYYNLRNFTVVNCLYMPDYAARDLKKLLHGQCVHLLLTYSYRRAHLMLRGVEDFLRGPDWLSRQDPAAINDEVRAASDAVVPVDALPVKADPDAALRSDAFSQGPLTRLIRRLTLNGWLLPAKRRPVVVELYRPPMQYFFRADTVVKVDRFTRRATLSRRSYREALALLRRLRRVEKAVDASYDAAAAVYRARRDHLCSEAFWRAFLGF